jgi:hypothetical protein
MTESFCVCYVVTEMAFNTIGCPDVEDIVVDIQNPKQNYATQGQRSGVKDLQSSGTEGQKFNWIKSDDQKTEWIGKLELALDSPASY